MIATAATLHQDRKSRVASCGDILTPMFLACVPIVAYLLVKSNMLDEFLWQPQVLEQALSLRPDSLSVFHPC